MKGNFGKTNFGGIIMHGMNNFGLISRMLTDWAYPAGAIHRRLETRWVKPVKPGDTIQPTGIIKSKQVTQEFALGADRRHGEEPGRREGRDRRGDGGVSELVPAMGDMCFACCRCFETLASLAPRHEVVVFQPADCKIDIDRYIRKDTLYSSER